LKTKIKNKKHKEEKHKKEKHTKWETHLDQKMEELRLQAKWKNRGCTSLRSSLRTEDLKRTALIEKRACWRKKDDGIKPPRAARKKHGKPQL
jgi:hypothetical protein